MSLGLVLSGGGALGAFQAGVAEAVAAAGLEPTLYSGTSAGAVNAAGLAGGIPPETVSDPWRELRARDVHRLRRDVSRLLRPRNLFRRGSLVERLLDVVGWTYLLDTTPLRRTLVRVLGGERIPVADGITLVLTAVDLATGDIVRFCNSLPPRPASTRGSSSAISAWSCCPAPRSPCCSATARSTAGPSSTAACSRRHRSLRPWPTNPTP